MTLLLIKHVFCTACPSPEVQVLTEAEVPEVHSGVVEEAEVEEAQEAGAEAEVVHLQWRRPWKIWMPT